MNNVIKHYDLLIDEGNDPLRDGDELRAYMDNWDGITLLNALDLQKTDTVLEIGVGTGRLAEKIAPFCGDFYGIDISPNTILRAKENLSSFCNINFICSDFMTYVFSRTFDKIYSSLTFMHIREKATAIKKAYDLLNDNGRFVLSIDKNKSEYIDMGTRRIKIYPDNEGDTKKYFKDAGFQNIRVTETGFAYVFSGEKLSVCTH